MLVVFVCSSLASVDLMDFCTKFYAVTHLVLSRRPFHLHYWIQALSFYRIHSFTFLVDHPPKLHTQTKLNALSSHQNNAQSCQLIFAVWCVCVCGWVKSMISFKLIKFSNGFHYPVGKSTSNLMPFPNTMNTMTLWTMGSLLLITASDTLFLSANFFFHFLFYFVSIWFRHPLKILWLKTHFT